MRQQRSTKERIAAKVGAAAGTSGSGSTNAAVQQQQQQFDAITPQPCVCHVGGKDVCSQCRFTAARIPDRIQTVITNDLTNSFVQRASQSSNETYRLAPDKVRECFCLVCAFFFIFAQKQSSCYYVLFCFIFGGRVLRALTKKMFYMYNDFFLF